jgi:hypothetical protein
VSVLLEFFVVVLINNLLLLLFDESAATMYMKLRRMLVRVARCSLTLLFVLALPTTQAFGQTHYIAPDGDDANAGLSAEAPLRTFDEAVSLLTPGDTLVLLDGVYTENQSGFLNADCDSNAVSGTEKVPITVMAKNERKAWIKSNGSATPVALRNCSYWDVNGLRASSGDYEGGASNIFLIINSDHVRTRRLLLHHANRYENSTGLQIMRSHRILVEDTEVYHFHRHGISTYQSDRITIRRAYVDARDAEDLDDEDAWGSHRCCRKAGDEGFSFYFTSNSILENSISTHSEQLSIISGVETVGGHPGGQNIKVLGSISLKDLRPGFLQSRKFKDPGRPYTGPAKNIIYKDYLIVGGQQIDEGNPFSPIVAQDLTIDGATWVNTKHTPIYANPDTRELKTRFFLGCGQEEVGGCDYDVRNALFLNGAFHDETLLYAPERNGLDFLLKYANAWGRSGRSFGVAEDISDNAGQYQQSMNVQPTKMGLGQGECIVFVPGDSNMSGAGKNGQDIGANILYRYVNGELTDEPLWDPVTGAFPHGAVIEDSPNDPGLHDRVAANVHKRLNVNTNGCTLPYGYK